MQRVLKLETDAELPTWFKVGGRADRLARPESVEEVRACLELDPRLVVLGDGANLLVDDAGVDRLVVSLGSGALRRVEWPGAGREGEGLYAGAGANLMAMCTEAARRGLAGLETLGGIPASVGGAIVMNAGGKFGEIASLVRRVHAMDRAGREVWLDRAGIDFGYRRSGLGDLVVLGAELQLRPEDPVAVRARLKDVMEYKRSTQPMDANSAGCAFKNPTLDQDVAGIGSRGERVSAGMVIDRTGCKGLRVGSAEVSVRHGNFLFAHDGAGSPGRAGDVIALIEEVERRVMDRFGIRLEREVVIWRRGA